ncbi:MAG TPA: 30S ribosomal protein S9 [Actinobacteria bacterium]|nr:30S ribosomal protein S9 [Actinomycetota bacterium]
MPGKREVKTKETKVTEKGKTKSTSQRVVYYGTGRRKEAVARVRLVPGKGEFNIEGKNLRDYFGQEILCTTIRRPLEITNTASKFDVIADIRGGGVSGQAGALVHGISRALLEADESFRDELKKAGLLTRDPRMKERRKYGLKKARKRPQFSKR